MDFNNFSKRGSRFALLLVAAAALAACGGGGGGSSAESNGPTTENVAPVANAGPSQSVIVGSPVTLDGAGSSDSNGDRLSYRWELTSKPTGSTAAISDTDSVRPTFVADIAGTYVATLIVNDGSVDGDPATTTVVASIDNAPPIANAGSAQGVLVGETITLDGSGSTDANGDELTYRWTLTSKPEGSNATLSDAGSPRPKFLADVAGTYTAKLVVSDGVFDSPASEVSITVSAANIAPVARAGDAQSVLAGSSVTLDGSGSMDANGDALTYQWTLTSKPAGSAATLSSRTASRPTFTADAAGVYVATLVVSDGKAFSQAASVTVTAAVANVAPVANAGPSRRVVVGSVAFLDGSASSDANGDVLNYRWTFKSKPVGSVATISANAGDSVSFTADVLGEYVVQLIVDDGALSSPATQVVVTAVPPVAAGLAISKTDSLGDFCGMSGQFSYFDPSTGLSQWTINNCHVYGSAGSILWARVQNNTTAPVQVSNIHVLAGYFGKSWSIADSSQTLAPGAYSDFALPLWMSLDVTGAVVTFTVPGSANVTATLSGRMLLP